MSSTDPLSGFSEPTRRWFSGTFAAPTPAQAQAWEAIAAGEHTVVIAPTGSGKTLAAFLSAIDRLTAEPGSGTRVLYVSPLKALAIDVERNLRTPLAGIARIAGQDGTAVPDISVGVRSGDTPPTRRRELIAHPPDILITTPESLFLMLTSAARETLTGVTTVIIDEVHAVAATKRGAHLAVSLERLDVLLNRPAQRIGLSATVRPPEEVARFLTGGRPARIVAPPAAKTFDLSVQVPIPDMTDPAENTIWPDLENRIADLIGAHTSTIVFANSRRLAERLTTRLNEIHAERLAAEQPGTEQPGTEQAGTSAAEQIARAHHGSMSKEQRADVEEALKAGRLRAAVATSSLELGIDMGAVDLVIQVESPPSVASGLQRVGRAGHQVGEVSRGVLLPKHRTDLIGCAVSVRRMLAGQIENIAALSNPLDVLAQHTVAACALGPLNAEEWFDTVRRSAVFATLPRSAFEATLDLLSGKYPSTDFAELRPRLVYDRDTGTLTGRPGAQRLAVTSGGAIPDRGLFTVYLAGEDDKPSRVGELDEEMVYESRPGDVIALGATSWRITDITHDRVLVVPAPGRPARLPFWRGDDAGRSAELGEAIGQLTAELAGQDRGEFDKRCTAIGFDSFAADNLWRLLDEQRQSTGVVPSDTALVVERFRDELGDWRVILHSPYGLKVHGPLALAVGRRLAQRYGIDEKPTASDDGIVVRLPDTDGAPPGAEMFLFDADEIEPLVTAEVGGSALFASRFRECAARALLLPRRHPGKRSPLWHQRQRSAQLLDVAKKYPDFPIVLEAVRECLQDVYDVPALTRLMSAIAQRRVRLLEVQTPTPSPFAAALLFGYVGAFMYEGDSPLAERRAAALSLDTALLAELMGRVELRELLDPEVIAATEGQLQHLTEDRRARDAEGVADLLRLLGPLTESEIAARSTAATVAPWLDALHTARRIRPVSYADRQWWVAVEDIGRLRDAVGVAVPPGVPAAFTDTSTDPLGELLARYARTRGPFGTAGAAARFGLGLRVAEDALSRLSLAHRLVRGEFTGVDDGNGGDGSDRDGGAQSCDTQWCDAQWCDAEVLRILRRRSLAALRAQVEPVSTAAYARFLPAWQQVGSAGVTGVTGVEGLFGVIEQLAGTPIPASAAENLVFASRVRDYQPAMLDELLAAGDVIWSGVGALPGNDGWVAFHPAETAALTLSAPAEIELTDSQRAILEILGRPGEGRGAFFSRQLPADTAGLWGLVWAGLITGDTFAPVRALLTGSRRSHAPRQRRAPRMSRFADPPAARLADPAVARLADPAVAGRWSALPAAEADSTLRAHFTADLLMNRYGVLTRNAVAAEGLPGGFATLYKVLSALEETGRCQRGYFVESLGGAQFAVAATVDRLRGYADSLDAPRHAPQAHASVPAAVVPAAVVPAAVVLAATDPANPFGTTLPWPTRPDADTAGHRPGRKSGALVVLVDGVLVWYLERGGRSLLTFGAGAEAQRAAATGLADLVGTRRLTGALVEKIDGAGVIAAPDSARITTEALLAAGFARTPRGLRLR